MAATPEPKPSSSTQRPCASWWCRRCSTLTTTARLQSSRLLLGLSLLASLSLAEACDGPGPLTGDEVRWRWRHGKITALSVVADGVTVSVACPAEHGEGVTATVTLLTREVREFERRDPLLRRDPFQFVAWRRCQEAADLRKAAPIAPATP
jgi:hypothetical protein